MKNMTQGNPLKLILMFSMPLMLGNILQEFYTIVDTIIVGQFLGVKALASMGAAGWIQWMLLSVVMGFAQGFSIKVANYMVQITMREFLKQLVILLLLVL
ncbi:MAG: MATE family efflux transporter [Streptococcus sp.]